MKKKPAAAVQILDALERHHPDADTELVHRNAFELLVATILSAQSTDRRVNEVTPALFAKYPDAAALMRADASALEREIRSTGFFRQKTKALLGMSRALSEEHGGAVPASMEALTKLPGVGRKTANVVLGHALGVPGLPVDRHVLRVTNRLGLVHSDDPVKVEALLGDQIPPTRWTQASDTFILHGRRICRPKPNCPVCNARPWCEYFLRAGAPAAKRPKAAKRPVARKPAPAQSKRGKPPSRGGGR